MEEVIEITGEVTEDDLVRVMKTQQKRITYPLNFLIGMFAFFLLIGTITSILSPPQQSIFPAIGFMTFIMLMFVSVRYMISRNIKQMGAQAASYSEQSVFHFDSESLQVTSASGSSKTEWAKLQKVVETKDDFLFFPMTNMMWPIPKALFKNKTEVIKFRALLTDRLGQQAKMLKS